MDTENDCAGGLSDEQKVRISQNFRAAKALLARKRPREPTNPSLNFSEKNAGGKRIDSPAHVAGLKRFPLSEIPSNIPSPASTKALQLVSGPRSCNSCSKDPVASRVDDNVCSTIVVSSLGSGAGLDSFETPRKKLELSGSSCSREVSGNGIPLGDDNLSDRKLSIAVEDIPGLNSFITPVRPPCFSILSKTSQVSSLLDDEFDESTLEEIDALCEKVADSGSERCSANFYCEIQSAAEKKMDHKTDLRSVFPDLLKAEGSSELSEGPECGVGGCRISEAARNGSMPEEYVKYLNSLNERQRQAASNAISVPLIIVAGPGSGKTSTMVGRVLMLLNEGIAPSNILAMTFTTAAASEMRDRVGAVAGKAAAKELTISTFHSFCLQLCRLHAEKLDRTSEFLIYGHGPQRRAIIEAVRLSENAKNKQNHDTDKVSEELNGADSAHSFKDKSKKWQKFVTQAKASGMSPEDCHGVDEAAVLRNYSDILKSCNALDYHDLISCSVKLLKDYPEVLKESQETWKAIVIDEFQDTSAMQYSLLRALASHNHITVVGDEDQSIFSFNGADVSGFDSFRRDFPGHKEIRLNKNYRSTRCIVEAASFLIQNNLKRCNLKNVLTDNSSGSKITVKECRNEDAQCAYVVDKILELTSDGSPAKCNCGNIAVLYRRQVTGKVFQTAFRDRKIPFNIHGVAFYRKKVVKAIIAMLKTALPGCDDGSYRQVFKALLPFEKDEKKKIINHIDKVSTVRRCSYIIAARDIFNAKISGTFKRIELTQGRKVLLTLDMISKLAQREDSISAVVTAVANMIPQRYLLEQRAVLDVDGGKLLNEDNDIRSVLQYLLDDVSEFLSTQVTEQEGGKDVVQKAGCLYVLKTFIDNISERERENFRSRRHNNGDAVTLTTIHQSKGLEWDNVFIVKANDSEIPLLHEFNGVVKETSSLIEEERRLLYVAMTRARKKLFILHVMMDSNWQMLQPSRFLKEIPKHLQENQDGVYVKDSCTKDESVQDRVVTFTADPSSGMKSSETAILPKNSVEIPVHEDSRDSMESMESCNGYSFLRRFSAEDRSMVSQLFHKWAKKAAFQDSKRLLDKVAFAIDERLTVKKSAHKDLMRALKSSLKCDEAVQYAQYIIKWEQMPADERANISREKQEHFQKLRIEKSMSSSAPSTKQIDYLKSLGCTVAPTSRLHASRLIEEYKSL